MNFDATSIADVQSFWQRAQIDTLSAGCYEDAAQSLASAMFADFHEPVVLARVFLTVPYAELPATNRQWVKNLATRAGVASQLQAKTPVLSLVGTCGVESEWCDRRQSRGHIGIPLVSAAFVSSIPMITRLLQELGVALDWIDEGDSTIVTKRLGNLAGSFLVADAASAVDQGGRKIIPAQDFVRTYGIRSVFGLGGAYFNGSLVVFIVFSREAVVRRMVERFLPLVNSFKSKTLHLVSGSKIFRP